MPFSALTKKLWLLTVPKLKTWFLKTAIRDVQSEVAVDQNEGQGDLKQTHVDFMVHVNHCLNIL